MTAGHYRRRLREVDAFEFDGSNHRQLALWCGGRLVSDPARIDAVLVQVGEAQLSARRGDFIVREDDIGGQPVLYPMAAPLFRSLYEAVNPMGDG